MATVPFGEALALGLASGPACVASCGPVLIPSLLSERSGMRVHGLYLSAFLATRFLGYVIFAAIAWEVGTLASFRVTDHSWIFAAIHLLIAAALLRYAYSVGQPRIQPSTRVQLVSIGSAGARRLPGAAILGLLTGISLCPPFVAAGIRAAECSSLAAALIFFGMFFVGTSLWFVPFAGLGWLRRNEGVITVARMAMTLIALFYLYIGLMTFIGRN